MNYLLTKSKYIRGLQCERAMFLDVYKPKLAHYDAETLAKFRQGRTFEKSFKETFPDGIDISARLRLRMDQYPLLTANLLQQEGEVTLFEAGFLYDDVLVLADVVHKQADGGIILYEVKNSTAVSDTFRNDVAVQHYVISHVLPDILPDNLFRKTSLMHFYVLYNDGQDGFVKEDLLPFAQTQMADIAQRVARFKEVLHAEEPTTIMSSHCDIPYKCPYKRYCGQTPANNGFPPAL